MLFIGGSNHLLSCFDVVCIEAYDCVPFSKREEIILFLPRVIDVEKVDVFYSIERQQTSW